MNRQTKRMMKRQEAAEVTRPRAQKARPSATATSGRPKKTRTPMRQYVKESAAELRRVDWPSAKQVRTYTLVTIACVVVIGSLVALFDFGVSELVVRIFA